jgi:quinol monooxygenase YgiN
MSIMIIVDAKIKEEGLSTFKEFFGTLLPDTRNFVGNEGVTLCTDSEDSGRVFFVEKLASKNHK